MTRMYFIPPAKKLRDGLLHRVSLLARLKEPPVFSPFVLCTLILVAAFSRIVPHMPNFSPLNAIALFAAAHFSARWQAIAIPLAATWLSDLFLNNVTYAGPGQAFVWAYPGFYWQYLAYVAIALMGILSFRGGVTTLRVIVATLAAGGIFFVVSNFGVWVSGTLYPPTFAGLIACYVAAVPFYQGTLMGDFTYATLLFGGYAVWQRILQRREISRRVVHSSLG